jgi:hypothetical protein
MKTHHRHWPYVAGLVLLLASATWTIRAFESQRPAVASSVAQPAAAASSVMPQYDESGALRLPQDYRRWIMVGASLGISYSDMPGDHEMFAHTLMEPTAYKAFVETGKFREGTMLALVLQGKGEKVLPARRGQFASDVHGVEMAVKDSSHAPEGWSYYAFGGMGSVAPTAKAAPKASCYSCHAEHAARDHVFLQFYPLLSEAAAPNLGR